MGNYNIPEHPIYQREIRKLEDTDPAHADTIFNPLFETIINNVEAVKKDMTEQISDLQAYAGYTDNDIVGVEVDFKNKKFIRLAGAVNMTAGSDFNRIKAFGGRRRCNVTNDGTVTAYYGDDGYCETGKLTKAVTLGQGDAAQTFEIGTIVQTMVEQPSFYYKVVPLELEPIKDGKGYHMRKGRYYVSDTMKVGFKLHPAFICNGAEKKCIYLSAFEGSLWDVSTSTYVLDDAQVANFSEDMLASIAGVKPASGLTQNLTRGNMRLLAQNRGSGWQQVYGATVACTQMLMAIEYCGLNMKTAIGQGVAFLFNNRRVEVLTGGTSFLGNDSGMVSGENGKVPITYRGEENFWGNIWKFVDGLNIYPYRKHELYVADHDFIENKKDGHYVNAGFTLSKADGFISAFGYSKQYDWLFFPSEAHGDSSLPVGDYYLQNNTYASGYFGAFFGGSWDNGSNVGGYYWTLRNSALYKYSYVGGRLVYIPIQDK